MNIKKKILLDRFPSLSLSYFYKSFKKLKLNAEIISYNSKLLTPLENYYGELLNDFEISRGSFFDDVPWMLHSEDLEFLSKYEGLFQSLLSRFSLSPSYWASHEMSTHATLLFNFWKYKLVNKKIDICFSFFAPHDPSSFSLYIVSKFLKIPYIFIDSPIIAQNIYFMSCSFKYRNLLIRDKKKENDDWVKKILKDYQHKIKNYYKSSLPLSMNEQNYISKKKIPGNKIINALKNGDFIEKVLAKLGLKLPPKVFFKYNRLNWYSEKAIPSMINLYLEKKKIFKRILKTKKKYHNKCSSFQNELIGTPYIYFAAPLSPESSNLPTALWNRDIKVSILKILNEIPEDWKIVYKANPFQFDKNFLYKFSTFPDWFTSYFYYDLMKNGKVSFVRTDTHTKDLIENSMGVASINGTVSLEAVALGKHAIIFSPMWYDALEGIHLCKSKQNLKDAIELMKNKDVPKPDFANINISSESIFKANDLPFNFSEDVYRIIVQKFISSYETFKNLDDKKWSI